MNYFFVFLIQTLLPFSLLLACSWVAYPQANFKKLAWLAILSFIIGSVITLNLPNSQNVKLALAIFSLCILLFAYLSQFIHWQRLNTFWHIMLAILAGSFWAKDPNITAITETDVINTDFLLHISAIALGFIFCLVVAGWCYILFVQSKTSKKTTALRLLLSAIITLILIAPLLGDVLLILMKLQVIELTKVRLSFVAKSGNITTYLNYINAAILAVIVLIFALNIHRPRVRTANSEQQPIEKRKAIAAKRTSGKIIGYGITAILIMLATQFYWDRIASQPPQLSEAQRVTLDAENNVHIPIEQVKDGKLHRFLWVADDGKAVRFFIINRLPDKLSLAAVFDACILCGDQGYVMEGNQVVCVGCGVRMFTPSIGKPGGCNPVPIDDWKQTDTEVVINKKNLEEGLNYFSTIIEIEVVDPVNGKKLTNTKTEHKYSHEGKTYFFTDEKNLDLFRDNPEAYLNKADEASTAKEEK
ncbi:Fe-S-containing protein [Aggregatibacter kilianii]|jgi:integral membrane protein|uniref:Fe-S-containing protein n=1 Tax=Aggregatibacter kilianii TaxID=2025884 RepID=UPI000D65C692|nr:Fe-S-containing protein [Aggregatibacter kilianii]